MKIIDESRSQFCRTRFVIKLNGEVKIENWTFRRALVPSYTFEKETKKI